VDPSERQKANRDLLIREEEKKESPWESGKYDEDYEDENSP